jgi:hypothetical protein
MMMSFSVPNYMFQATPSLPSSEVDGSQGKRASMSLVPQNS